MPIQFVTDQGTLFVPGAYPITKVQTNPSNIAVNGVIAVVGEADGGPDVTAETDLTQLAYGPDQVADIITKYKSGPIVDAFRAAVAASNDNEITGSFSTFIPIKTNVSTRASGFLGAIGGGNWSKISDKSIGKLGNLINYYVSQKTAESVPTTGALLVAPPQVNTAIEFRVNGGSAVSTTINTGTLPSAIVTAVDGLAGVAASGGTNRAIITAVAGSLTVVVDSGRQCHINVTGATLAVIPTVGDILYIPTGSPLSAANEGTYVVTAATNSRVDAYKLLDAAGTGAQVTPPTNEGPIGIAATTDMQAFAPVVFSNEAGAVVVGLGKSLELAKSGSNDIANNLFVFANGASPPAMAFGSVSESGAAQLITSASEYQVTFNIARQSDNVSEQIDSTNEVVLSIGYTGTTATAAIASGAMTLTTTGGTFTGSPFTIPLADYKTIADLATYISSLSGFSASVGNTTLGQGSPLDLDEGTFGVATSWGAQTGRIKANGARTKAAFNSTSVLANIDVVTAGTHLSGLPAVSTLAFLSGGSRGSTSNAQISAGLQALEELQLNFVVPLFSRDATKDISDGLTDSNSTYTIDAINQAVRSHVLEMSKMTERRPRQGFLSYRDTFVKAKSAASNMGNARLSMTFHDIKDLDSNSNIKQFQPWLAAVKAAGMQAAAFYKGIVNRFINCSGALVASGDYKNKLSYQTDALKAGLLPIFAPDTGGFAWVSDQTTYTRADSPIFNSIQAMYVADILAQTIASRMGQHFVGQAVGDISASLAKSTLENIMAEMLLLKLTAPSDDAPAGFRNASIKLAPPALIVSLEAKLDTLIYFVPITLLVTTVQQTA